MAGEPITVQVRADGRTLHAVVVREGRDLVVSVGGGDRPHVGCVVMAVPRPSRAGSGRSVTVSVLALPPHREEAIARPLAESLARAVGGVVTVSAGVHEEGADAAAIETWLALGRRLGPAIVERLRRG